MVTIQQIVSVINKFPHSEQRVPYTYHHDYVRQHAEIYKDATRSRVASSHDASETELFTTALCQILDSVPGSQLVTLLDSDDLPIINDSIFITKKYLERLESYV